MGGRGTGGRGGADSDGLVDVVDLVLGIDYALGRLEPSASEIARVDVYPFSSGDGQTDVRDLTVLAEAIVANAWPDGVGLPSSNAASKTDALLAAYPSVTLFAEPSGEGWTLRWEAAVPIRSLQLDFAWKPEGKTKWDVDRSTLSSGRRTIYTPHHP